VGTQAWHDRAYTFASVPSDLEGGVLFRGLFHRTDIIRTVLIFPADIVLTVLMPLSEIVRAVLMF
jgi:hypothetical protein